MRRYTSLIVLTFLILVTSCKESKKERQRQRLYKHETNILNNLDRLTGAETLAVMCTSFGREKTKELFDKLSPQNKRSEYGKTVEKYLRLNKDIKIGDKFIDFTMQTLDGDSISLSDINSKYILLEFWSAGCAPCIKEFPFMKEVHKKYDRSDFDIVAVSMDENESVWKNALEKYNIDNWINVSELKSKSTASLIYGVSYIPRNFLIDSEKRVIIAEDLRGEQLLKKLEKLF